MAVSLRVLIADDESLNALVLRAQLEALGHEIVGTAHNGLEALSLARNTPIDLAILDHKMPGLTGLEAAIEISAMTPVPTILLTGNAPPQSKDGDPVFPFFQVLIKPASLDDLTSAIAIAQKEFSEWWGDGTRRPRTRSEPLQENVSAGRGSEITMLERGILPETYDLLWKECINRDEPIGSIARTILISRNVLRDTP